MSDTYKLTVNQNTHFEVSNDAIVLDAVEISPNLFHVLHNNSSYKAEIVSQHFNSKSYTIKVNNNIYTVNIADELDILIQKMGIEAGKSKTINSIKAPMPGLILEINVEVGQQVTENEPLLILEAMKMENSFLSPRNGIIKSIEVSVGTAVDKGQLLIEFE